MLELASIDLWDRLGSLTTKATRRLAAVAYVSSDSRVRFDRDDVLVCDASDERIANGDTSARVLTAAHRRGAKVFSVPGLHAKVMVFDDVAVIGSANVSLASERHLTEAALVTDDLRAVSSARKLIEALRRRGEPLEQPELKRLRAIPVVRRRPRGYGRKPRILHVDLEPTTWFLSIVEGDLPKGEEEGAERERVAAEANVRRVSSSVDMLRFVRSFRLARSVKVGDLVIEVFKPKSGPVEVYPPLPIVGKSQVGRGIYVYVEMFRSARRRVRQWREFVKLAGRAGVPKSITTNSNRRLTARQAELLGVLWK